MEKNQFTVNDITQEILVKVAKYIKFLKNPDGFNVWLHKIMVNNMNKTLRDEVKQSLKSDTMNVVNEFKNRLENF